jgi:phospholipid/cholesterol/gamma-HCH transport system ATP-binding protein
VLGRRFGMPGLPLGGPETVRARDLVRAACVTAFLGTPELVVIADRTLDGIPELAAAMAQAVGEVQDRGGAVLWLVGSFTAPAARFVAADHALRLRDRGLSPVRRQR